MYLCLLLRVVCVTRKALRPCLCSPSPRSPFPQGAKYVTVTQDTSPSGVAEVCNEYLFGRAKTGSLGLVADKKQEKPHGHCTRRCSSSSRDAKYITVTKDTSPSGVTEVCGGSLGLLSTKTNGEEEEEHGRKKGGYY